MEIENKVVLEFALDAHKGYANTGDINKPFNDLPLDVQKENLLAGKAALESISLEVQNNRMPGSSMSKEEVAATYIHEEWKTRNPSNEWNENKHVPFVQLPFDEQKKYVTQVEGVVKIAEAAGLFNEPKFIDSPLNPVIVAKNYEEQLAKIKLDGYEIRDVRKPTLDMQLAAVNQDGHAIQFISNPEKSVQMAAIQQTSDSIRFIDHPDIEVQRAADKLVKGELKQISTAIKEVNNIPNAVNVGYVFNSLPKEAQDHRDVIAATVEKTKTLLAEQRLDQGGVSNFNFLPEQLKTNSEIIKAYAQNAVDLIKRDPENATIAYGYDKLDDRIKNFPGVAEAAKEAATHLMSLPSSYDKDVAYRCFEDFCKTTQDTIPNPAKNIRDNINALVSGVWEQHTNHNGITTNQVEKSWAKAPEGAPVKFGYGNEDHAVLSVTPKLLAELAKDPNFTVKMRNNLEENLSQMAKDPTLKIHDSGAYRMESTITAALAGESTQTSRIYMRGTNAPLKSIELAGPALALLAEKVRSPAEIEKILAPGAKSFPSSGFSTLAGALKEANQRTATGYKEPAIFSASDMDKVTFPSEGKQAIIDKFGANAFDNAANSYRIDFRTVEKSSLSDFDVRAAYVYNKEKDAANAPGERKPFADLPEATKSKYRELVSEVAKIYPSSGVNLQERPTPAANLNSALMARDVGVTKEGILALLEAGGKNAGSSVLIGVEGTNLKNGSEVKVKLTPGSINAIAALGDLAKLKESRSPGGDGKDTLTITDARQKDKSASSEVASAKTSLKAQPERETSEKTLNPKTGRGEM